MRRILLRLAYAAAFVPVAFVLVWATVPWALVGFVLGMRGWRPPVFYWFDLGAYLMDRE